MKRVLLIAIMLQLGGLGGAALAQDKGTKPEKPAAIVNGEAISRAEFDTMWAKGPGTQPNLTPEQKKFLQGQFIQTLIDETLFQQYLKKNVPPPDPVLIQQRIAELEKSLKARGKTLQQFYTDSGQSPDRLTRDITAVVQWNAYTKKYITDADCKKYYEDNKELFDGVMIRASQVFIRVAKTADAKALTDARTKLLSIRQEALKGTDFGDLAKKHSQDASAANGGDLGYFPPSGKNEQDPFLHTVSAMKVNEISQIVQTDYGFHLIKVTDRKAGKPSTLDDAREDARILVAEELRLKIVEETKKTAKVETNLP